MIKIPRSFLNLLGTVFFGVVAFMSMSGQMNKYIYFYNVFSEIFFAVMMTMTFFVCFMSLVSHKLR